MKGLDLRFYVSSHRYFEGLPQNRTRDLQMKPARKSTGEFIDHKCINKCSDLQQIHQQFGGVISFTLTQLSQDLQEFLTLCLVPNLNIPKWIMQHVFVTFWLGTLCVIFSR